MRLTAWRVALRIARRDALRAKGRSALVLAMIALPVLGVTGADVVYRSATLSPAEQLDRRIGAADLEIGAHPGSIVLQAPYVPDGYTTDGPPPGGQPTPEQQRSLATDPAVLAAQLLPAGSVLTPIGGERSVLAASKAGQLRTSAVEADLADPIWHGRINVTAGRAPAGDHEIAVTQRFLDDAGLGLGATTVLHGLGDQPFTISGRVEYPNDLARSEVVGRPGGLGPASAATGKGGGGGGSWLVRLPAGAVVDWAKVQQLDTFGFVTTSRSVVLDPPARSQVPYFVKQDSERGGQVSYLNRPVVVVLATVAGMALLEIVLLAGPAFAVGARRSRRQLGLLAAGGGDRSHVRAVVLSGGVVLGLAGALVGMVLAVLLVVLTKPWTEPLAGRRFGALTLAPLDLLGVAAIGLVTGLLAAVVPAFQASRQDVVSALTGRGGVKPPSKKLTLLGLLMLAGGAALALLGASSGVGSRSTAVLGGSMVAELGMVACTPMVVGLFGKLGRWLPLGPRLALRDSVRHRGRTAPAVAAVMAAVAGSVAIGIYGASADEQNRQEYTAYAPSRAVTLIADRSSGPTGEVGDLLAAQRSAVERSIPALGPRADVRQVDYHGDCHQSGGNSCGQARLELPEIKRCPLEDVGYGEMDPAAYSKFRQDPRCQRQDGLSYGGRFGSITAGDATVLHNLFDLHDSAAEQAVAAGRMLVFDPLMVQDGKALVRLTEPYDSVSTPSGSRSGPLPRPASRDISVDAVLVPLVHPAAGAFLSPETAARLGLTTSDAGSTWLPAAMPSGAQEQKATAEVAKITGNSWNFEIERGFRPQSTLISLGLTGFAALVALGAAGIATGLASADSQQDLTTLAAVGAAPRIRRTLSGFQCGVIAAMGAVLGTICGVVPAVALRRVEAVSPPLSDGGTGTPIHVVIAMPWLNIGLTLVVLPLLAVLLATVLSRSKITLLRRAA